MRKLKEFVVRQWHTLCWWVCRVRYLYRCILETRKQGFATDELYGFNVNIAKYINLRFPKFRELIAEQDCPPPGFTTEEWLETLKQIAFAFDVLSDEPTYTALFNQANGGKMDQSVSKVEKAKAKTVLREVKKGLQLFVDNFDELWV